MNAVIITCAIICTVAFVALAVQAIVTLRQIANTARSAEYLALHADQQLTELDPVFKVTGEMSKAVNSGWFKFSSFICSRLFGRRK